MILFITGRAELVEAYDDIEIRSTNDSFQLPKVLRLFSPFKRTRFVKFNRDNVFHRDKFTCQYCITTLRKEDLTLDHVIPRSKGGGTSWENVVTCCKECNNKKGSKLPAEFHLKLKKEPMAPKWSPFIHIRLKKNDPTEWRSYLGAPPLLEAV